MRRCNSASAPNRQRSEASALPEPQLQPLLATGVGGGLPASAISPLELEPELELVSLLLDDPLELLDLEVELELELEPDVELLLEEELELATEPLLLLLMPPST